MSCLLPEKSIPHPRTGYCSEGKNHSSDAACNANWVGHGFTYGCSLLLEQVLKISRPLKPGYQDQFSIRNIEITARVFRGLGCLVIVVPALVFGLVGAVMRAYTTVFATKDFTFISNNQSGNQRPIRKLMICTFNVALLPEFVIVRNGLRSTARRVVELARILLSRDDDIICLQEAFHTEAVDKLARKIKSKYPYIVKNVGPRVLGLNSGLMIASKYPITNPEFYRHGSLGGACKWSNKGVLAVTVNWENTQAFVFNTHLNAGANERGKNGQRIFGDTFRKHQLKTMQKIKDNYIQKHAQAGIQCKKWCQCGDFNISLLESDGTRNHEWDETTGGYAKPILGDLNSDPEVKADHYHDETCGRQDRTHRTHKHAAGTTFDFDDKNTGWNMKALHEWPVKPERVDHILSEEEAETTIVDRMEGVSDHLAVRATFNI